jgi:hypothetical protein
VVDVEKEGKVDAVVAGAPKVVGAGLVAAGAPNVEVPNPPKVVAGAVVAGAAEEKELPKVEEKEGVATGAAPNKVEVAVGCEAPKPPNPVVVAEVAGVVVAPNGVDGAVAENEKGLADATGVVVPKGVGVGAAPKGVEVGAAPKGVEVGAAPKGLAEGWEIIEAAAAAFFLFAW